MQIGLGLSITGRGLPAFYPDATLALDFLSGAYRVGAGATSSPNFAGLPGLTVTRASTKYAQTSSGLLVQFPSGVAAITDQGLLVEEARTNLLLRSQAFTNASWTTSLATGTDNVTAAPDGTTTAASFVPNNGSVNALINQTVTVTNTTAYAYSVYLKNGTLGNNWIELTTVSGSVVRSWFNLATGAAGTVNHTTGTITPLANGWFRVTVTVTSGATTMQVFVSPRAANGNAVSVNGDGVSVSNYLWQADLQAGTFITSPIPTTSAAATRAADVVSIGGLSIGPVDTFVVEALMPPGVSTDARITLSDGTTSNRYWWQYDGTNLVLMATRSAVTAYQTAGVALGAGVTAKAAIGYDGANYDAAIQGVDKGASAGSSLPSLTQLEFANAGSGLRFWNGYIRKAIAYNTYRTPASQ